MVFLSLAVCKWRKEVEQKQKQNVPNPISKAQVANSSNDTINEIDKVPNYLTAWDQSIVETSKWLAKHALLLGALFVLSGSVAASLKVVNSKLFGMNMFDMGLNSYELERSARHRVWLTVGM